MLDNAMETRPLRVGVTADKCAPTLAYDSEKLRVFSALRRRVAGGAALAGRGGRRRLARGLPHRRGGSRPGRRDGRGILAALLALDAAQPVDVPLMLVVVLGEDVPARSVRHEEDLLGARRIGRRLERGATRIVDRS